MEVCVLSENSARASSLTEYNMDAFVLIGLSVVNSV